MFIQLGCGYLDMKKRPSMTFHIYVCCGYCERGDCGKHFEMDGGLIDENNKKSSYVKEGPSNTVGQIREETWKYGEVIVEQQSRSGEKKKCRYRTSLDGKVRRI